MSGSWLGPWAYLAVFVALMAAGLGFPIPEEIPVVGGGIACAQAASHKPVEAPLAPALALPGAEGDPILALAAYIDWESRDAIPQPYRHPLWWIMLPVCIVGVVTCDAFLYGIGRWQGPPLLEKHWVQRYFVSPEKRAKIEHNFQKYGVRILLGVRLLPGVRAPVFVMAGIVRLPLTRFLLADGLYAIPGVTLLFSLAYWFTDQVLEVVLRFEGRVGSLKPYFIIGGIAAFAAWLAYEYWSRRSVTGDPKEVPLIGPTMIKPPHAPVDKAGSVLIAPVAEQQAEVQERLHKKQGQHQSAEKPREKWSVRTYAIAAGVATVVCAAVYATVRRRARKG